MDHERLGANHGHPRWWVLGLRGLIAAIFGMLALAWPAMTLLVLVALFAAYALLSGATAVVGAVGAERRDKGWWLALASGLASMAAGVLALLYPGAAAAALVILLGAYAMVVGGLDIPMAIRLRKAIRGEWLHAFAGLVSIIFGLLVFMVPTAGALVLAWLIGAYALASAVLLMAAAWRVRKYAVERKQWA